MEDDEKSTNTSDEEGENGDAISSNKVGSMSLTKDKTCANSKPCIENIQITGSLRNYMVSTETLHLDTEKSPINISRVNSMEMFMSSPTSNDGVSIGKADCVQINLNPEAGRGDRNDWSSNIYQAINKPMHEMFVKTQHYNEAREKLKTNRIVVISGSIGTGKTFLARKLISEKIEEGYQLKSVESLFKWRTYGKQIVLLDDVFSKPCNFSRKSLELKSLLKTIQLYLEPDDETGKTVLLIITIRPDVLAVLKEDKSLDILQKVEYQVDLMQPIPFKEKLEILRTHEKKYSKSERIDEDCAIDICNVKCPCFPICVKLFFQQDDLFQNGIRFFENPVRIIQSEISQMYKDDREVFAFLIMLILNEGEINESCLGTDACIAHIDPLLGLLRCRKTELVQIMNECLDRIPDLYVTRENNKIKIQHDCIFQAICVSFSKILPMP
ncbi:uncharacterized protein LOC127702720 [Mytilus californianus]|uniref:uncharacterized protein LOC127702720 n=1 Tax=Mytilus californianus TaxID=6549 RepID=UPI0022459AB0|nr:uncharacterized protein LOC127702720 [Mytilus californianus]